ncbi:uncharacterized protein TrAtP1_011631 [Trichoderma atroviride]|uniref:uncharacterized protein n=1 Tax=Hypocrea atroviridis TaxID=63577 RepID=UPI003327E7ED|nr:hypothetical protein TrAtP1_011631 [Trichoderma atroviride]
MVPWAPTNKTLETLGSGECPTRQILDIDRARSDVNVQLSCNPPLYGVADLTAEPSFNSDGGANGENTLSAAALFATTSSDRPVPRLTSAQGP